MLHGTRCAEIQSTQYREDPLTKRNFARNRRAHQSTEEDGRERKIIAKLVSGLSLPTRGVVDGM
eukprot:5014303-Prymnesium_polylepis.2